MASLLGFLGALGNSLGVGSQDEPNALTRLNNMADPVAAAQRQEALAQQSALAALTANRNNGVTNPQQNLNTLGQYDPEYTVKAAAFQAQNPLAALLQSNNAQGGQAAANLTGEDFLKTLPPTIASQIKGIAEGKQQLPQGMGGAANRQALLQLVNQYDPSFDAVNYNSRAATRKDFTSGKSAQNITAMNTALGHLSSLSDAYDKLDNTKYAPLNAILNPIESAFGDTDKQAAVADVKTKAHAVSEELAKVFRSTGMAESDVKAWENSISTAATPAESKTIIKGAIDLLNSRLDALGQQYNQGMGTSKQGIELLSPHAQQAYQKLLGQAPQETAVTGNLAADNASQQHASGVSDGATATNPKTGQKIVLRNGKWEPVK